MKNSIWIVVSLLCLGLLAGCGSDDNRKPTAEEGKAADQKRLDFIDKQSNLTEAQKAQMKAHMGGSPPSNDPAMAARQKSAEQTGRRN